MDETAQDYIGSEEEKLTLSPLLMFVFPRLNQAVMKKLETATNNTKSWKHKVAEHEGLLRLIGPGKCSTCTPLIHLTRLEISLGQNRL